jgi:anaerobic selenocysteine-containing dehydrogenase
VVGLATVFGAGGGTSSYAEIEDTDVIVMWGSNARDAHPIFFHHVLKGVHNGAKLFVVDPRRTSSAKWAHLWLGNHVGTDIALSNTIAREIIHAGTGHHRLRRVRRISGGVDAHPWQRGHRRAG